MTVRTQTDAASPAPVGRLVGTGVALVALIAANALAGGHRWWANFVLVPAVALAAAVAPLLLAGGRGRAAAGYAGICVAVIVSTVGLLLLFSAVTDGWPVLIIVPCLALAGTARWRAADPSARAVHRAVVGLALLGCLLGVTFLLRSAGLVDFGDTRWWGYFMIAAGGIWVATGLPLLADVRGYRFPATVLLAGLGAATILAGVRELFWR